MASGTAKHDPDRREESKVSARWRRTRAVRGGHVDPARPAPDAYPTGPHATGADATGASPADPGEAAARASIEALLGDMRELRLTLMADLSAAAAAVEDSSERVAADIVDGDRRELAAFLRRSTARVQAAPEDVAVTAGAIAAPSPRSWRRRALISLPAVPLVGALAMSAAAAAGLLPLPTHSHHHAHVVAERAVPATFQQFETVLNSDPSASQVVAAASALHQQIAAMLATSAQSPSGVTEAAQLLQLEQALLLRKQPPGSSLVLAQSRKLAARLLTVARASTAQPTPAAVATPSPSSSPKHPTTSPKTSPSTSPTAKSSTAKPASTSSPSPSSSPSSSDAPGHLPSFGG